MAGVQVPTLDRSQAPEPASVGRIEGQQLNPAPYQAEVTRAAVGLGEAGERFQQNRMVFAANNAAMKYGSEYYSGWEKGLNGDPGRGQLGQPDYVPPTVGAKQAQGDPTPIYSQLTEDRLRHRNEILKNLADTGADSLVISSVNKRLAAIDRRYSNAASSAYGAQNTLYVKSLSDSEVKLGQKDLMDATAHLDVSDPDTYEGVDQSLKHIEDARYKAAEQFGTAQPIPDPTGKKDPVTGLPLIVGYKSLSPKLDAQIAKDKSDGLYQTIKNLIDSGDVEGAKDMTAKYGKYLDGVHAPQINKMVAKATKESDASLLFNDVKDLPYSEGLKKIDEDGEDPETIKMARAQLHTFQTQMESAKKVQATENFTKLGQNILNREQNGQPYLTVDEMWRDPLNKRLRDQLTPEQMTAAERRVKPLLESDPDALQRSVDLIKNANVPYDPSNPESSGLKGMPMDVLALEEAGLNRKDKTALERAHNEFNKVSPSDIAKQSSSLAKMVETEAMRLGITDREIGIKKNQFGKYQPKDQIKLHDYVSDITGLAEEQPVKSQKEQEQFVKNYFAEKIKNKPQETGFFSGLVNRFLGPSKTEEPAKPTTTNVKGVPPQKDQTNLKKEALDRFVKVNGRAPSDPQELQKFIKSGK